MTPQECEHLTAFLDKLTQMQTGLQDAEAEALIVEALTQRPGAAYALVQRAAGLEGALRAAQQYMVEWNVELNRLLSTTQSGFPDTLRDHAPQVSSASPALRANNLHSRSAFQYTQAGAANMAAPDLSGLIGIQRRRRFD